jgi:FkbM family methyltransferase
MHDKDLILMTTHAAETRAAALNIEHEWDRRAIDWPLTKDSVVVEVGGYKGRWAFQIVGYYQPRLYVFEPQPWAFLVCRNLLRGHAKVLPYALGITDGAFPMGDFETDGCSFVKEGTQQRGTGQMREIGAAFAELSIRHIDLMLINIEGYEYTLIPHMLDRGILPQRLMVQFHDFADPTGEREQAIRGLLVQTGYREVWTYGAVLTAWERA